MIASNLMWVSESSLPEKQLRYIKKALVIRPKQNSIDPFPPEPIQQYWTDGNGNIGMPFAFAEGMFPNSVIDNQTSLGFDAIFPKRPTPRDEQQKKFFDSMTESLRSFWSVFALAPTGTGKTVALLNSIASLGRTALVVVPSVVLAEQWMDEAIRHTGVEEDAISIIQGSNETWQGKSLVICVIHNLYMKEWGMDFRRYFGTIAWDECHKLGARVFSETMAMFYARYKVGVTATPNRKDKCDALYKNYFGEPLVVASTKALACDCYALNFEHKGKAHAWIYNCVSDVKPMKWLAKHQARNNLIVDVAKNLYQSGRNVLILSKFIEHVEYLIAALSSSGIPASEIGQFTRSTSTGKKKTQTQLNEVKENCRIIVATYTMMKEGVDIPRLDAGIEALPTADAVQAIGRIRRQFPNKKKPKWFSIIDKGISLFEGYASARIKGFNQSNVNMLYIDASHLV